MIGSQPGGEAAVSNMFGHHRGGPTVLRIVLGSQLRRLREQRQITCEEAGEAIRASHSKISRMELVRVWFWRRDVADLLTLYGVTGQDEREAMLSLADQANEPGWWHSYSDILPNWFEVYIGLEEAASRIRAYEVQFVPGLLQTEDYARAVTLLGHPPAPGHEVERREGDAPTAGVPAGDHRAAQRHVADGAVQPRGPRGRGRAVQHPAVRRARPARRGLPRTAHQRPLPRQARGRRPLPHGDGAALHRRPVGLGVLGFFVLLFACLLVFGFL